MPVLQEINTEYVTYIRDKIKIIQVRRNFDKEQNVMNYKYFVILTKNKCYSNEELCCAELMLTVPKTSLSLATYGVSVIGSDA